MMRRLDGTRLRYTSGTGWRCSNVGYLLIGRLIERLTDLTLDDAVIQRALSPLGISNVRFAKTRADLQTSPLCFPARERCARNEGNSRCKVLAAEKCMK